MVLKVPSNLAANPQVNAANAAILTLVSERVSKKGFRKNTSD